MLLDNLITAFQKLKDFVSHTPVLSSHYLNLQAENFIFLKTENLQKTGSFKIRGVYYMLSELMKNSKSDQVVTHSSGNHGQALAYCAHHFGIQSYVVLPIDAPKIKRDAIKEYGGIVIDCPLGLINREMTLKKVVEQTQATFVPPYDHRDIILGQASVTMEFINDVDDLDYIIAPIGGGGLLAGASSVLKYFSKKTILIGAEPAMAAEAYQSLKTGILQKNTTPPQTLADGLKADLSELTFSFIKERVKDIILVSEKEIIQAFCILWQRLKVVVEPSGAVALAAALKMKKEIKNKRIGVILSGGNVDITDPILLKKIKLFL